MATRRITAELVEKMQPGDVYWDDNVRGFGVRHRGRDAIYCLKCRIKRRQTILTIGRHGAGYWSADRARREAVRLLGLIRDGKDPAAERNAARNAPTLEAFADRYMTEYAEGQKKPRTVTEDKRLLRLHILPALGRLRLVDIGKADVARFHSSMRAVPVAANRALALLSAIMGWAERVGERPDNSNPCRHIDKNKEKSRERFLSAEELARLGDALATAETAGLVDWRSVSLVRLLLFTGARLSEILTLRWDWIDLSTGIARLPDSKTGAKNLFLSAPALELLAGLPRVAANPYVLPGDRAGAPFVGAQKPWQRIRATVGLEDVHLHDLRHSFASVGVAGGDSLFVVGKLLGHRQSATTERYAHLAPDPATAAADRMGGKIAAMLGGGRQAEIIEINPTRKRKAE
jgi:integrase